MHRALLFITLVLLVGCGTPANHRGYRGRVAVASVASAGAVVAGLYTEGEGLDGGEALMALGVVGYFAAVPAIHAIEGNRDEALRSALRRVVLPLALGGAGALGGRAVEGECGDTCGLVPAVFGTLGALVGATGATVWDLSSAHVPTITTDGERTIVGIGGRF